MAQQNFNKSETTDDWEEMVYGKCYKDDPTDEERAADLLETDRWDDVRTKMGDGTQWTGQCVQTN